MTILPAIRLFLWRLAHVHRYGPEIRHFFWRIQISGALLIDRALGHQRMLIYLSNCGQAYYILPVMKELRARKARISFYLALDQQNELNDIDGLMEIPRRKTRPLREYRTIRQFEALITPVSTVSYKPPVPQCIYTFHSQPAKGPTFVPEYLQAFDTLFFLGPLQKSLFDEFRALYPQAAARLRTFDVGYPKSDALIRGEFSRERILTDIGLDFRIPTVLFAPAFDRHASLSLFGEAIFEALASLDVNVVVKLHPVSYDRRQAQVLSDGIYWPDVLDKFNKRPRFRHVGNVALDPYIAACDMMVTDISSASFEAMMLDRPVVFIDCPEFMKLMGSDTYPTFIPNPIEDIRANAGRSAGIIVKDMVEMKAAILRSLAHPEEFSAARQKIRGVLLYNPGHAAEVAAQTILDLLERKPG